jgi:gluconate kinase
LRAHGSSCRAAGTRFGQPDSPMSVVWLNGPVGAGKSTLAHAIRALVHPVAAVALLDEDELRQAAADATESAGAGSDDPVAQLGGLARVLSQQGLVVVVAASDSPASGLAWNRANLPGYREVYLRASFETIKHRARRRRSIDSVAPSAHAVFRPAIAMVDVAPPTDPELTLDMDNPEPPELLAFRVAVLIPEFVVAAAGAAAIGERRFRRGA